MISENLYSSLLWQTLAFTTLPYALVQWASKYADEMTAALYDGVVEPLVGGIVAWVIFRELATSLQVTGGLIMVLAFGFSQIVSNKHFLKKVLHLK